MTKGGLNSLEGLRELLQESQPLLLFLVIGIGYLLGQIKIKGIGLGIAGVLFVGLAFGAWQPEGMEPLHIAEEVRVVGLILFVYAIGLSSGPGFFTALRQNGVRFNLAVLAALVLGAIVALVCGRLLGVSSGLASGAFCGGLTNTPALAAVTQMMNAHHPELAMQPTLGYSLSYPFGVLGGLFAFQVLVTLNNAQYAQEESARDAALSDGGKPLSRNYEIRNPKLFGKALGELRVQDATGLIVSRVRHGDEVMVPTKYTAFHEGDVVVAVGKQSHLDKAVEYFGAVSLEHLESNRERIEMRRVLVSNKKLVGKTIEELELDRRFNAQITRLRRADLDIVPTAMMTIELGDRLRIVMPKESVSDVTQFFGDSERHIAELDYTAITLGICLGVLVGMIPIPIPGGASLSLGFAGGPLIVALVLGKIGRSGPIVWSIPHESNMALRHIGLLFFLAGVGVSAGGLFLRAIEETGWQLILLGFLITTITTATTMLLLRTFAGGSVFATLGATSGMQTQPATLARAHELTRSDQVYITYATTYPVAMIGKILLAQIIVLLGSRLGW